MCNRRKFQQITIPKLVYSKYFLFVSVNTRFIVAYQTCLLFSGSYSKFYNGKNRSTIWATINLELPATFRGNLTFASVGKLYFGFHLSGWEQSWIVSCANLYSFLPERRRRNRVENLFFKPLKFSNWREHTAVVVLLKTSPLLSHVIVIFKISRNLCSYPTRYKHSSHF